ncbi:MAG: glycosyltransferase [Planctomycetales bacterium]|nr:glycosyltransferase [bacterium]UNM08028.1 MAG: glycosyltransferase [Planctomycetales bacterium]
MPRAVHVTTVHNLFDNRIFMKECASLRDNGWDVVLVAQHDKDETVDGISIRALPKARNRMQRMRELPPLAMRIALEEQPDILHFHDPELLPVAAKLATQGKRVLYDMHENILKDILTKPWIRPAMRPLVSSYMRMRMKGWLSRLRVVFAEESYAADYPYVANYTTVLNMPRLEVLSTIETERAAQPTLAYVGGLTEVRGSLRMLKLMAGLQANGIDAALELVGPADAAHKAQLDGMISELGIRHVRFHGFQRADSAWPLVAGSHAGLALLSRIPNYEHSYPSKVFEYMALGLPVITSDFELYKDLVEANGAGICVNPDDENEVLDAAMLILTDSEAAAEMSAAGRRAAAEKYSWANEEQKLLALYQDMLG